MTNIKYIPILTTLIFILGLITGFYAHELQDQKNIQVEAYKLYQENINLSTKNYAKEFNISVCEGDINGR